MNRFLVLIVGCRGAGKTTLLNHLRLRRGMVVLQPSTTRARREELDDEYEFCRSWSAVNMAWSIRVGEFEYGMRLDQLSRIGEGRVGVTVCDPSAIDALKRFRIAHTDDIEVVTVGLDTLPSS